MPQVEQQRRNPARDVVVNEPSHPPNPGSAGLLAQSTDCLDVGLRQFRVFVQDSPVIPPCFQHPTNCGCRDARAGYCQLSRDDPSGLLQTTNPAAAPEFSYSLLQVGADFAQGHIEGHDYLAWPAHRLGNPRLHEIDSLTLGPVSYT